ncbi:MAG: DUF4252 domain-containing protein [Terracidiphilus sp.]
MQKRIAVIVFCAAALALPALAQTAQLPAPSPVEKELTARASSVDEVTLDKSMLAFATNFMNGKDKDGATRQLVEGLDGIYVRDYKFDKEGKFTAEQVEQLRKYFETNEWSPLARDRDTKTGKSSDVMVKLVNGKSGGLFILDVEPKEISIVLILGPIHMQDLGEVLGAAIPGALAQQVPQAPKAPKAPKPPKGPKGELEPQGDLGSQNDQVAQGAPPAPPTPPAPAVAQAPQVDAQGTQGPQDSQGGKQNQRTPLPKCKGKSPCFP